MIKVGDNLKVTHDRVYIVPGIGIQYIGPTGKRVECTGKFKIATSNVGLAGVIGLSVEEAFQMLYEMCFNYGEAMDIRNEIIAKLNRPHVEGKS